MSSPRSGSEQRNVGTRMLDYYQQIYYNSNRSNKFNENFINNTNSRGISPQSSVSSEQVRELTEEQLTARQQVRDKQRRDERRKMRMERALRELEREELEDELERKTIEARFQAERAESERKFNAQMEC